MSEDENRPFPIMESSPKRDKNGRMRYERPCTVPWWLAEIAYKHYRHLYGGDQSLKRIAERGGFGRIELVTLLKRGKFDKQSIEACGAEIDMAVDRARL